MWLIFALGSAGFAALTTIFAKIGMEGVNSNLATAIRTVIILIMAWMIVLFGGHGSDIMTLTKQNWTFLILSGIATGLSWLCYFYAISIGNVSQVAPIDKLSIVLVLFFSFVVLKEPMDVKTVIGGVLIAGGTLVLAF